MKTEIVRQVRSLRERRKQEKGVALVTVLAIVMLMTVLVTSFFLMSTSELNASVKDADNLKVRALADAAVNIVIGQIREATTPKGGTVTPWISQPGAIRTFQTDGQLDKIFKLYSSSAPIISTSAGLNSDVVATWNTHPGQWVDINAPIIVPDLDDPENINLTELYFPIADPRAYRGNTKNASGDKAAVEGFSYESKINGVVMPSGSPNKQRLPMPVRWLYILSDGAYGFFDENGGWQGAADAAPSKENPIVARIAYWTDDESCKINVNTASEGVYWDTPHTSTTQDASLGNHMPVNGEYQRYPGHPASVCLSSVLFPNKRWKPPGLEDKSDTLANLKQEEIQSIWRMAPFIYGEKDTKSSFGGTVTASSLAVKASASPDNIHRNRLTGYPNPKHLYASFDDYVIASTSDADKVATDRKIKERVTSDEGGGADMVIPTDRLQQGRFFLTSRNAAPEVTLHGTPRIALWPIHQDAVDAIRDGANATGKYTVFDSLIAFNSMLSENGKPKHPYFITRKDVNSRHSEWYVHNPSSGGNGLFPSRDEELYRYLLNLANRWVPGFRTAPKTGISFADFGGKYGASETDNYGSIMAQCLDFMRSQNLYDGNLEVAKRYVGNDPTRFGQVTPFCLCGGAEEHRKNWYNQTAPKPKGLGRLMTISEVALWIKLNGKIQGGKKIPQGYTFVSQSDPNPVAVKIPASLGPNSNFKEYQASLIVEGFVPGQGWGEHRPWCSVQLTGGSLEKGDPATQTAGVQFGPKVSLAGHEMVFDKGGKGLVARTITDGGAMPRNWIGWGGTVGPRVWQTAIDFKPWAEGGDAPGPGGGPPETGQATGGDVNLTIINFSGSGGGTAAGSKYGWRLVLYDNNDGAADATAATGDVDPDNLIQCLPLGFPAFNFPPPTNPRGSTTDILRDAREKSMPVFDAQEIVQSLVPTHGDYRLIAARRMLAPSAVPASGKNIPMFVAHPNYGASKLAHSLREPMPDYDAVSKGGAAPVLATELTGYFDKDAKVTYKPEMRPDFPICPYDANRRISYMPFSFGQQRGNLLWDAVEEKSALEIFTSQITSTGARVRNSTLPGETGDFETGVGPAPDGPYSRRGDEGNVMGIKNGVSSTNANYFTALRSLEDGGSEPFVSSATFSPNRMVASAAVFGAVASGVADGNAWNTLLFRPDLYPHAQVGKSHNKPFHFGALAPYDHLLLDLFWMPVVEPYSISEPFATAGKINMNYRLAPFNYIKRATAMHALLKGEMITAIPNVDGEVYKIGESTNAGKTYPIGNKITEPYRRTIDAEATLTQFENRFDGLQSGYVIKNRQPGAFISPTEICEQWLVPSGLSPGKAPAQFQSDMEIFWDKHRLTGENLREKPYGNLYARLTTKSNTFRVHVIAQTLRKAKGSAPDEWDVDKDSVTSEYRGSYLIERSIDPTDPGLTDYASIIAQRGLVGITPLDAFYTFRISQVKQFVR